jgi:hypothetical protein
VSDIQRYAWMGTHTQMVPRKDGVWMYYADHLADKAAAVEKEQDKTARIMRLLESLTPGGSEYHNEPERCAAYVRDRINALFEQVVEARVHEKRAVARAVQEERERCGREEVEPLMKALQAFMPPDDDGWWCPTCRQSVDGSHVTYQEYHEACGTYIGDCQRTSLAVIQARQVLTAVRSIQARNPVEEGRAGKEQR